jgi:hypothetical protein
MEAFGADAAMVLGWTAAAVGGFAAAATFILANRNVWFARTVGVMVLTLMLPYVALGSWLWANLCGLD